MNTERGTENNTRKKIAGMKITRIIEITIDKTDNIEAIPTLVKASTQGKAIGSKGTKEDGKIRRGRRSTKEKNLP